MHFPRETCYKLGIGLPARALLPGLDRNEAPPSPERRSVHRAPTPHLTAVPAARCPCRGLLCLMLCALGLLALPPAQARGCAGPGCPEPVRATVPAAGALAPPWAEDPALAEVLPHGARWGSAPLARWRLRAAGGPLLDLSPPPPAPAGGKGLLDGLRLRWHRGWQVLREVGGLPLRLRLDRSGPLVRAGEEEGLQLDLRLGPGRSALLEPRLYLGLHHRW